MYNGRPSGILLSKRYLFFSGQSQSHLPPGQSQACTISANSTLSTDAGETPGGGATSHCYLLGPNNTRAFCNKNDVALTLLCTGTTENALGVLTHLILFISLWDRHYSSVLLTKNWGTETLRNWPKVTQLVVARFKPRQLAPESRYLNIMNTVSKIKSVIEPNCSSVSSAAV